MPDPSYGHQIQRHGNQPTNSNSSGEVVNLQLKQELMGLNAEEQRQRLQPPMPVMMSHALQAKEGDLASSQPPERILPDIEQSEKLGGHALKHHGPDLTMTDLEQRVLGTHPSMPQSRTSLKFPSMSTMTQALETVFTKKGEVIDQAFKGGSDLWQEDKIPVGMPVGVGYTNKGTRKSPVSEPVPTESVDKVFLELRSDKTAKSGRYIWTFYPSWP